MLDNGHSLLKERGPLKESPFLTTLTERSLLSKEGSTKRLYHLTLALPAPPPAFKPGDALGIYPENAPEEVEALLEALSLSGNQRVLDPRTKKEYRLREYLQTQVNLTRIPLSLLKLTGDLEVLSDVEGQKRGATFIATHDLVDLFTLYRIPLPLQELLTHFAPLLPRFYSIASSPKINPTRVDLLVSTFTHSHGAKERPGLGSHFLCHLATPHHTPIRAYIQPTTHFALPHDPRVPILMIGPGTGVAPFRAFLQEREAIQAPGKNWLVFGERHRATDYYYESYLQQLQEQGFLRIDLAFSRDQKEKLYVQHRLLERGEEVWEWLSEGAHLYICGDATHMAKDVLATLHAIVATHSRRQDPKEYLRALRRTGRLSLDVY